MALPLHIPDCIVCPNHPLHPPPPGKPLRITIQGPLESIQKLLPDVTWHTEQRIPAFPQPAGAKLADITYQQLYKQEAQQGIARDLVVRDEYLGWVMEDRRPLDYIDYYGVTFDYLVPSDDTNPEVLAINLVEVDNDDGAFANEVLPFAINPADYTGKKVLAVPRCCQKKKGTTDRSRINGLVMDRKKQLENALEHSISDSTLSLGAEQSNEPQ